jgi:hypothetical protein
MAFANAVIGAVRIDLGMDTAKFSADAKKAKGIVGGLSSAFKGLLAGAVAALSVGALSKALGSVIDHADELGKTAQKIGIPVEELSKLEFAARLADVSLETLSTGVTKLSKNMAAIAGGEGGDAAKAMAALGVAVTDASGKLRPASEVMADIAAKFAGMRDGAGKTALSMHIFGKAAGPELIPSLNGGREAIAAATAEAERFGIVIDKKTAKAAEAFNDNLTRLKAASEGLTTQVAAAMLPALVDLTNAFVESVKSGGLAKNMVAAINFVMKESKRFLLEASAAWQEVTIWINAAQEVLGKLGEGDFLGSLEAFRLASQNIEKVWADTAIRIADVGTAAADLPAEVVQPTKILRDAPIFTGDADKPLSESLMQSTNDARELNNQVLNLSKSFEDTGVAAQTLGNALGETFGDKLQSWFGQAIDGTFKFKDALGDLLSQLAKVAANSSFMSFLQGASNPVHGGGFLGGIGKLLGFANGGEFKVGGAGGIDSQVVAFRASPNERVRVTKPGQDRGGVGMTTINNIDARGADPGQIALLREELRRGNQTFSGRVKSTVQGEKANNPRFAQ